MINLSFVKKFTDLMTNNAKIMSMYTKNALKN